MKAELLLKIFEEENGEFLQTSLENGDITTQDLNTIFDELSGCSILGYVIYSLEDEALSRLVKLLLEKGADPYLNDRQHESPVVQAARTGDAALVSLLIGSRSQKEQSEAASRHAVLQRTKALLATSYMVSRENNRYGAIEDVLLQAGIEVSSKEGSLALHEAATKGNAQLVEKLLKLKADPNCYHPDMYHSHHTPLIGAMTGHLTGIYAGCDFNLIASVLSPKHEHENEASAADSLVIPTPPAGMTDEQYKEMLEATRSHQKPGPHMEVIKLLLQYGAVPGYPTGYEAKNAVALAVLLKNEELIDLFTRCSNKMTPKTGPSSFFVYDIFDKNKVSTKEISTQTIKGLKEGECIVHRGDLIVQDDIPTGAQLWVIDGNVTVQGNVGKNSKIFASFMPLVRLRDGMSYLIGAYATQLSLSNVKPSWGELYGPFRMVGSGSLQERKEGQEARAILNGIEFIIPYVQKVQDIPSLKEGKITIKGDIEETAEIIASGVVLVKNKRMITPSPNELDPETGELRDNVLPFAEPFCNPEYYPNMFLLKKTLEILSDRGHETRILNDLLFYSAFYGQVEYVKLLLTCKKIDVNYKTFCPSYHWRECTPLLAAIMQNHSQIVNLLIAAGAKEHTDLDQKMQAHGQSLKERTSSSLLFSANRETTESGDQERKKTLEEEQSRTASNKSRLFQALRACQTKKDGQQLPSPTLAFRRAARVGKLEILKTLIELVPNLEINEPGPDSGKTALDFAKEGDHPEVIAFLKQYKATPQDQGTKSLK